jgi:biopolymer transport protein ExbD
MSYRLPSARRGARNKQPSLNLVPILDAIFIFIFYLLSTTTTIQLFELNTTKPIVSNTPPPKNQKKPLGLTIKINNNVIRVMAGNPLKTLKSVGKLEDGKYDLESLHEIAVNLKSQYAHEDSAIFMPLIDLPYEDLVKIIDAIRTVRPTDDDIYVKDKDGIDVKAEFLFEKIVFGNLLS